ncbi:GNAT family N-acetyltransferase [Nocardioides sp. YIM 152588]|uniref:GNAT family N-acetyltransferase n=1 Tax=Nocardioides sp. YIM 152588 TaxID=3158259 RepID=UPI0032E4DEFB
MSPTGAALEVGRVDVARDDEVAAWLEVINAVDRHERGEHATPWYLPEVLADLRTPQKNRRTEIFVGTVDGAVVAAGEIRLPLQDNLTSADLMVWVLPDHRRRGHGSAVLARLEEVARADGRTRYGAMTDWPYAGPPDGAGAPGVEFGRAHGYAFGLGDIQREVVLPVDGALLDRLAAEAAEHTGGYTLRTVVGRLPDDLVAGYVALSNRLMTEAPMGEVEREEEAADVEAFRQHEDVLVAQGRTVVRTLAVAASGEVAAYTDLVVPSADPTWVFQWGTLVDPAHRGHRLGIAVKVANLVELQRRGLADGRRLVTWNAEVNGPMIGINEQLGFVPTGRSGELQKKAPAPA